MSKFKIGDKVLEGDRVGIIVKEYSPTEISQGHFDWEVAFINGSPTGCYLDCCRDEHLKKYPWRPFPKRFKDKLKLLLGI